MGRAMPNAAVVGYTLTARVLHWVTAALVLTMIPIGIAMANADFGDAQDTLYHLHRSIGAILLPIMLGRLLWRLRHPAPPLPASMPGWQRLAAHLSHGALYTLLVVMPVTGWLTSSALGVPTVYLGLVSLPELVTPDRSLGESLVHLHHTLAFLLAILIGVPIGMFAALKQNSALDHSAMGLALAGVSIPNFVLGPVLVLGLSLGVFLLPPALWQGPSSRVLPVLTLSTPYIAYIARLTRGGMLEVLRQDFVRTARAKGLAERAVVYRHALRNSLLPVVTFIGWWGGRLLGGLVIMEIIFVVPGMGSALIQAVSQRDYPTVQAMIFMMALVFLIVNLTVDLLYAWLDPRIRYA